ncbi:hypothetical protein [Hyphomicrobium sp.]|uniref:hypothetical protein n=1 Tax=Hyphomicrobium sp. TaxID=82 RepID=UPI0025C37795|nr:hypothetical protein [Hyphomicrobium sp.]MCC7250510.1 hypothetical protein [Hyphomicrobium sp.]
MIGSAKEWASLLGFDRDADERTMAARTRVLARTLAYLEDHFSDPDGARPTEALIVELGQFLVLAEAMESKGRGAKFKELYETVVELHLNWDETDREEAFQTLAKKAALFKGILAFSDAWLGTETSIPRHRPAAEATPLFDEADVKTRIVNPSYLRP